MKRAVLPILAVCLGTAWPFWPRPALSHEVISTTVLFDREIVRILNKKCVACHTENNLAFPLTTYQETRPWARSIEEEALRLEKCLKVVYFLHLQKNISFAKKTI